MDEQTLQEVGGGGWREGKELYPRGLDEVWFWDPCLFSALFSIIPS